MKKKYSYPQIEVLEMELGTDVLFETSTTTVPIGGEGDNSREYDDRLFFEE